MIKTIDATFDGEVFHPQDPLALAPNTRVRLTIETMQPETSQPQSFLHIAGSLNLDGPSDWAANLEDYLYSEKNQHDG